MELAKQRGVAPALFYCALQLASRRAVTNRVRNQVNGSNNQGNHAPGSQQQIHALKIPELFVQTGLAHSRLQPPRLSKHQHSDISLKLDCCRLPHASTQLAGCDRARIA